jgi:dihydrolipoamide dehydrogenase
MVEVVLPNDANVMGNMLGGRVMHLIDIRAGQLGLRTVLVEADRLGGECLNYGCVPSKSLITVSKLYERVKDAERFGLKVSGASVDFGRMQRWKSEVVSKMVSGVELLLKGNHVSVIHGKAQVADRSEVTVATGSGTEVISSKKLVLATGTAPVELPGLPFDGEAVITSKEALELRGAPGRLAIVGGGAIGLEFASMYQKLGSEVTVIELMDQLMPGTDTEVAKAVQRSMERKGVKIHLRSSVAACSKLAAGARLEVSTPDGTASLHADKVLVSVGRRPRSEGLNLTKIGAATDAKGFIITDRRMMTSVDGIFDIGDIRGPPLLAHKASKEGIVAAECAAGLPSEADWKAMPDAVFCDPEVASVGLTEAKAVAAGYSVKRSRFQFAALGRALSTGETEGFVKVVSKSDDGLILGVQIVGPEASNLISEAALAIEMGATVDDIALTVHPHPTLPEAIMEAAESAAGRPIHQLRQ